MYSFSSILNSGLSFWSLSIIFWLCRIRLSTFSYICGHQREIQSKVNVKLKVNLLMFKACNLSAISDILSATYFQKISVEYQRKELMFIIQLWPKFYHQNVDKPRGILIKYTLSQSLFLQKSGLLREVQQTFAKQISLRAL